MTKTAPDSKTHNILKKIPKKISGLYPLMKYISNSLLCIFPHLSVAWSGLSNQKLPSNYWRIYAYKLAAHALFTFIEYLFPKDGREWLCLKTLSGSDPSPLSDHRWATSGQSILKTFLYGASRGRGRWRQRLLTFWLFVWPNSEPADEVLSKYN